MFLWRQSISCPTGGYNRLRRRFRQRLVEVDRTSALVASTTCLLHRPYLWMSTMSYWGGSGSSRCWYWSKTGYSTAHCQRMADKTRSLTSGDSYHHPPTVSLVQKTRDGGVLHSHLPKSSRSQQNSEAEEEAAPATSPATIRAGEKMI